MAPIRKNGDVVEVSTRTFNFVTGLASTALVGVTVAGIGFYISHIRLVEQVKYLSGFAGYGHRYTWEDWKDHEKEFKDLRRDVRKNTRELTEHKSDRQHSNRRISQNFEAVQQLAIDVQNAKVARK